MVSTDDPGSDHILPLIGEFGRFQKVVVVTISLSNIFGAWHFMGMTFLAAPTNFWCARPPGFEAWSVDQWKNFSSPIIKQRGKKIHDQCNIYDLDYGDLAGGLNSTLHHAENVSTIPCTRWEFDRSQINHTIVNEWNLVCDRETLVRVSQSIFMFGVLVGAIATGMLSDRFGRRPTMMICIFLKVASVIAVSFSPSYQIFSFLRWLVAFFAAGMGSTSYVIIMEMLGQKWRSIVGTMLWLPWIMGFCSLTGLAYGVRDWQNLQLLLSLPTLLLFSFYWLIPESPRWLLAKGRTAEAEELVKRAAKENGRSIPQDLKLTKPEVQDTKGTILDLFRTPNMRKKTLNICFNWFVNSMAYYGLSGGTNDLGGNIYVNFVISGLVEFPAQFFCLYIMLKRGRKLPLCGTMILGGVSCMLTSAIPSGVFAYEWPTVTLATIGKFGITCSFTITFIYSLELYPTVVRNAGLGTSSTCARGGSMLAPFVGILSKVSPSLPIVVYGLCSVAGGLLVLLLPDTTDHELPNTVEEGEQFGKQESCWQTLVSCFDRPKNTDVPLKPTYRTRKCGMSNPSFHEYNPDIGGECNFRIRKNSSRDTSFMQVRSNESCHTVATI